MIKKLQLWLLRVWRWYRHRALYVIADPRDSSITLSKALFEHMNVMGGDKAQTFVFTVGSGTADAQYAFTLNPDIQQPTQLCDIQYNTKLNTIGFETLCPTVARIFYDYGISIDKPAKLSVDICSCPAAPKAAAPKAASTKNASPSRPVCDDSVGTKPTCPSPSRPVCDDSVGTKPTTTPPFTYYLILRP